MKQDTTPKKYRAWLSKIETREEAAGMVRETALALFFWAIVQTGFSFMYGYSLLIHAAILAVGSLCLLRWRSRTAAVVLLLYAVTGAGITLAIRSGIPLDGGKNVMLALFILWTAIKAVEASFRLQGRFALADDTAPAKEI